MYQSHTQGFNSPAMGYSHNPPVGQCWPKTDLSEICQTYTSQLARKNITTASILNRVLQHDLGRMNYALSQVQTFDVNQALHQFFGLDIEKLPTFIREKKHHKLNHMGLEIYTPLDIWLSMVETWQDKLSQVTGKPVNVIRTTRFPSSQALQTRVGAPVEILCVWFQLDKKKLMVELFDIGRPMPAPIRNEGLYTISQSYDNADMPSQLWIINSFKDDLIWHYAIDVENTDRVDEIHNTFVALAASQPEYKLAYFQPVTNRHDGSYHTKIIHTELGMELEFATHQTAIIVN